jgi:UDP-N-acetylmuramyl pentapeptide phosphotransferase/UDP-N-acetylglucosamine-1-phosphate transferase
MLDKLIEKVKDRDLSLGTILIIVAILVWIIPVKLVLSILGIYGLIQIFWKKEEKINEVHQHHHHHNNNKKPRKKNG